tara:strand:- start:1837 stop:2223 length:387 start_codon:yes stop_codon:yes gene_type:complete
MKPENQTLLYANTMLWAGFGVKLIDGPLEPLRRGYSVDFFGPMGLYFCLRTLLKSESKIAKAVYAGASFLAPAILEVGQKFGMYEGFFDPRDFLAYGLGVATALVIDNLTVKKEKESYSSAKSLDSIL